MKVTSTILLGGTTGSRTRGEKRVLNSGEKVALTLGSVHVVRSLPDVDGLLDATHVSVWHTF